LIVAFENPRVGGSIPPLATISKAHSNSPHIDKTIYQLKPVNSGTLL